MDKEKFKLRLDLKTGDEDIDLYIWELHNYLVNFEVSSVKQLLVALDNVAQKITDDLDRICSGDLESLEILSDDKESKLFDKVQKVVEKIDSWKKVSEMAEALRPEVAERKDEVQKSKAIQIDLKGGNAFEEIQRQFIRKGK